MGNFTIGAMHMISDFSYLYCH